MLSNKNQDVLIETRLMKTQVRFIIRFTILFLIIFMFLFIKYFWLFNTWHLESVWICNVVVDLLCLDADFRDDDDDV